MLNGKQIEHLGKLTKSTQFGDVLRTRITENVVCRVYLYEFFQNVVSEWQNKCHRGAKNGR